MLYRDLIVKKMGKSKGKQLINKSFKMVHIFYLFRANLEI